MLQQLSVLVPGRPGVLGSGAAHLGKPGVGGLSAGGEKKPELMQ